MCHSIVDSVTNTKIESRRTFVQSIYVHDDPVICFFDTVTRLRGRIIDDLPNKKQQLAFGNPTEMERRF